MGVVLLSHEHIQCDRGKVTPHRRRLCILNAEHVQRAPAPKNTVRSQNMLGWCLFQDKPYGTIILRTIYFCAYKDNYKLWSFLSIYIWTPTKILYKHRSMFWIFGYFDIVTIIFFREFSMLYNVWLCSCHPWNIAILFYSLSLNIQLYLFCQVINYKWIKTIKSEPTFGKSSICNQPSLSEKKEH